MVSKIKVSVLLVTYNHERFIDKAIQSILDQKTNYDMEIVVADDYSTDKTLEIIQSYIEKHPLLFKILPSERNLGITKNYERGFSACEGKYIAVLEGDDYWTDPQKIEKHVGFLESNKGCSMTFNRYIVHDLSKERFNVQPWPIEKDHQLITVAELVLDNFIGNFSTCVYRKSTLSKIDPNVYKLTAYDWMINIMVAQQGLIAYLPDVMSVYLLHSQGTWSQKKDVEKMKDTLVHIEEYDRFLKGLYHEEFEVHKNRILHSIKLIESPMDFTNKESIKTKIKKYLPPFVVSFLKWIIPPKFYK